MAEPDEASDEKPREGSGGEPEKQRPGHSRRGWLLFAMLVLIGVVLVVFLGWLPRHRRDQKIDREAQQRSNEKPRVAVYVVRRAPSASALMVPGTTLAYTQAYIYARASGYVTRRYADIGDRVREGQVLATIDAPDLDQQVAQARSALKESESNLIQLQAQLHLNALNWDRYKVLVAKGVFSRQQGDQQEANFRVAEANVHAAENTIQANRDNLERLVVLQQYERVTAPFDGVITARNIDIGALISAQGSGLGTNPSPSSPGTTLAAAQGNNQGSSGNLSASITPSTGGAQGGEMFDIAEVDRLRVLVSVPEAYSPAIRVGQRARLFFQEASEEKFEGKVTRTSASIDQSTRTLLVEVQVANPRRQLMPGMYTVVNFIDVQSERPLLIPGEAIVVRDAKQMVALVQNNVVHFRAIIIGRDYGDQTEVVGGGIEEGNVIVTSMTDAIQEGVQIDPQYPQPKGGGAGGQTNENPGADGQYGEDGLTNSAQKSGQQGKTKKGQGGSGKKGDSAQPQTK